MQCLVWLTVTGRVLTVADRKGWLGGDVLANLVGLVLIVALLAVGAAYGIDALNRKKDMQEHGEADQAVVTTNIAGVVIAAPSVALKNPGDLGESFQDRLDLVLPLPSTTNAEDWTIGVTLVPKTRARASSALLDTVYLKHFSAEEVGGVAGLIGKPLIGGDGYDGETVWYDPIAAKPFAAKCDAPIEGEEDSRCVRTLVLDSGLAAIVTFRAAALADWRNFDAALIGFFERIGAGHISG